MRKPIISGGVVILLAAIASFATEVARMKITSAAFQDGGNIPSKFTCDGSDTSPSLQITGVPAEAKSLVLIADDPDAPGGLFTHWLIWNIPPQTNSIAEGSAPKGVHGTMILANQVTRVRVRPQAYIGIRSRFTLSIANWICAVVRSAANSMPR
jgi:phosphatidylethanolamine-binding protein (PEBP) family uncharacterized protein